MLLPYVVKVLFDNSSFIKANSIYFFTEFIFCRKIKY